MRRRHRRLRTNLVVVLVLCCVISSSFVFGGRPWPRECNGVVKHVTISVGQDPVTEMIVSFATDWASDVAADIFGEKDVEAPIGAVWIGTHPSRLFRFVEEQEYPITYSSPLMNGRTYYAPFQHHITIRNLQPNTTYFYAAVSGPRSEGIEALRGIPPPTPSHLRSRTADSSSSSNGRYRDDDDDIPDNQLGDPIELDLNQRHRQRRRKLRPKQYDGFHKPCPKAHIIRSFRTAPITHTGPVKFAIIADMGQFEHSQDVMRHLTEHREGVNGAILVGDIAYTRDDREWDTFFDFLEDFSIFDEVPLQIVAGNHDIELRDGRIFQAYENRFRMPRNHPPELHPYELPEGVIYDMEAAPYPWPYEWGNGYYSFTYGPSKHIIVNAYAAMEPNSTQYQWIEQELKSVDRTKTPWVLVSIHVPLYNTYNIHLADLSILAGRKYLEPLMVKYGVNVVFGGHIHAYQRTHHVANRALHPKGAMHITIGAGGRQCWGQFLNQEPEEWLAARDASYFGYGMFEIHNRTHAEWTWYALTSSEDYDEDGDEPMPLPRLEDDHVWIENKHIL